MADENLSITKVVGNDTQILEIINTNFKNLTKRIKNVNLQISYLDVLRISNIYKIAGSLDDTNESRVLNFVASCWNLLQNYSGVYITGSPEIDVGTEQQPEMCLFKWQGELITNGAFIVKLPGNETLVIPAAKPQIYTPYDYDSENGTISYRFDPEVPSESTSGSVPTPSIPSTAYVGNFATALVPNGGTYSGAGAASAHYIYWYNPTTHEQIIMDRANTVTNSTNMELEIVVIY